MGLPAKMLGAGEHEVIHTRTHAKALVLPVLALLVVAAAVGAGLALGRGRLPPWAEWAIPGAGLVLVVWWVLVPFLRWRTTTYTITDRRLITRHGILNKTVKDLPLNRIAEVGSQRGVIDRMFGCGTLTVQTAAEDGTIALVDVPDVEHVHRELTDLLFSSPPPRGRDS